MLENTPGRFSTILSDNIAARNNFRTYLYSYSDLICALATSEDGQNILKTYTSLYPKKLFNECLVPGFIIEDVLRNHRENSSVVVDQVSQDMVINPVKITAEDASILEYREIYWWLLANRTHPILRETVLEVGQDPDDILVLDQATMHAIKDLIKTWLNENMHEKFIDIFMAQDGIDFLLFFSDTLGNLDVSVLQQSIIDGETTLTIAEYLQRSENGRELFRVICGYNECNSLISVCGFFDDDTDVDPNPSRSNYLK